MKTESGGARVAHLTVVHRGQDPRIHRKQCLSLRDAGYDVHLMIGGVTAGADEGIRMHSLSENSERPPLRRQPPRLWRAAKEAFALRADLYHLHDPHLILLGIALKWRGARVVYDIHEHYPLHARSKLQGKPVRARAKAAMWRVFEATARRRFDGFVCASEALAQRFPPDRTVVVGNFPILAEFEDVPDAPPLRDREPIAIFLGCCRPDRGVYELIEAAKDLPPGARLRFAGELRPARLGTEIREMPWADRMEVVPERRSRPWIAQQLKEAVVGVAVLTPTFNSAEGWRSNKLFEYMAAGMPVIVPDVPKWREIVDRYECGIAVPADDPAAIAEAINALLEDRERAEELGRNGREAVLSRLNWAVETDKLLGLYERLIGLPSEPLARSPEAAATTNGSRPQAAQARA